MEIPIWKPKFLDIFGNATTNFVALKLYQNNEGQIFEYCTCLEIMQAVSGLFSDSFYSYLYIHGYNKEIKKIKLSKR